MTLDGEGQVDTTLVYTDFNNPAVGRRVAVPTYDQFIEPILRHLAQHPEGVRAREAHEAAADALGLSEEDRAALLPSGAQLIYKNRAGWAHDRLKRAGLSESPRRGHWRLTERGFEFARDHSEQGARTIGTVNPRADDELGAMRHPGLDWRPVRTS